MLPTSRYTQTCSKGVLPPVSDGVVETSKTMGGQPVSQVPSTQGQSHTPDPIDSQKVTGSPVAAAWPPVTQQGPHSSSVVKQKGDLVPINTQNHAVVLPQQNSSLVNPASLQPSVTQQAPSYSNSHVEDPSDVPQHNIPQQTKILNLDTWFNLTEACRQCAEKTSHVHDLAINKDVFIYGMIDLLVAHWFHKNLQTTEGVSAPSNSSDSTAVTVGTTKTELTDSNGHSVLSKQEKLEKGLSNIEALFNAVKTRLRLVEDPRKKQPAATTNTTQKTSDTSSSWLNDFLNSFFPQSESSKESKSETVLETSQKFQTFYTSEKMDFEVLRCAVDTQLNITFCQDLMSKLDQEYDDRHKDHNSSNEKLAYLLEQLKQIENQLNYHKGVKNESFALLDQTDQVLKVEDNVPLKPLQQKAQILLLIKGMTAMKADYIASANKNMSNIINKNQAQKRSTLCQQLHPNANFKDDDYVVLNETNAISNKDQYKKPSHLITRFFYSLSRRLSPTDYSGEYREAMEKVRKSVSDDFGSQASQRFNIEFGSRYRSGRPLTFGALREFLKKEKALANGKEYVLQAIPGDNILQQEFEKIYPNTKKQDFSPEHKKVLFAKFLLDHQDFIVVKQDGNSSDDTSSLGKKDWWLWPSQPDIKKANRETLELSEPKFKELLNKNTKDTLLVESARNATFQKQIVPFLQQEKYLTIADITQVQSIVENLSEKQYDGVQGTFEALVNILSVPSTTMSTATNIAHAAAGARAFGNGNNLLHGVGNAASIGMLLTALPEEYGIRLAAATIFALSG